MNKSIQKWFLILETNYRNEVFFYFYIDYLIKTNFKSEIRIFI